VYHASHLDLPLPVFAGKGQILLPVLELAQVDFDSGMLFEGAKCKRPAAELAQGHQADPEPWL